MRLLYLTAHLSDVDLAQQTLDKAGPGGVRLEACASARDVGAHLAQGPADAVIADLSAPNTDVARSLAELRAAAVDTTIVALVRQGAAQAVAEALIAGADEAVVKQKEFFLQLPSAVAQAASRRQSRAQLAGEHAVRVLVVGAPVPAESPGPTLRYVSAGDDWWLSPAGTTAELSPDVVLIDESKGTTACVAAVRSLRDGGVLTPVVMLCDSAADHAHAAYYRAGAIACLPRTESARLRDTIERAIETTRLSAELALLRAKEQRLRALIEAIPTPVTMVSSAGLVQAMNLAGLALIGAADASEVVGHPFATICDPAVAAEVGAFIGQVCAGRAGQVRFPGPGCDGIHRVFDLRAVPMRRDRDASSALGVMRLAPGQSAPRAVPEAREAVDEVAVEVRLEALLGAASDARSAEHAEHAGALEALRVELAGERSAHQLAQARLEELDAQRAVSEAAWNAVQSELERKLILQLHNPAMQQEHEVTRALLEKSLRQKDTEIAGLVEDRDRALSRLRHLESATDEARGVLRAREQEVERLRAALEEALAARVASDKAHAERESAAQQDATRLADALARAQGLQQEVEAAAAQRAELEQRLAAAAAESASLAAERDRHRDHLSTLTGEVAQLRALADLQSRDQSALQDVRAQVARLQAAASTVEQQQQALEEASAHIERLREALEDALGTRTELESKLRDRQAAVDDLASRLHAASSARHEADTALVAARAETAAARDELDAVRQAAEYARGRALDLTERLKESQAETRALAAEVDAWRGRVEEMRQELDAARAAIDTYRANSAGIEGLERDLAAARLDAGRLQSELDDLRPALTDVRGSHDELARVLATEREDAARVRAELERAAEQLRRDLDQQRVTAESAQGELEGLRRELEGHQRASKQAQDELVAVRGDLERQQRAAAEVTGELDLLRHSLDETRAVRDGLEAALAAEREDSARLRAEIEHAAEQLRRELDERHTAASGAHGELDQVRRELDAQRAATTAAQDEVEVLRRELEVQRSASAQVQDELAAVRTDLERQQRLVADSTDRLASLQAELAAARETDRVREAEVAKLQGDRNDASLQLARERALRADLQHAHAAAEEQSALSATRLAGLEQDLVTSRSTLAGALDERNALAQALNEANAALARADADARALRERLDEHLAEAAARHTALSLAEQELIAVRTSAQQWQTSDHEWRARLEQAEAARQAAFSDQQSLRDQIADLQTQLADHRRTLAELEAQRDAAREAQARHEAGAQLQAARHHEEMDGAKRLLADARSALAEAEEAWRHERAALQCTLDTRSTAEDRLAASAVVGTATTSGRGRVTRCNDTLARLCGYQSATAWLESPEGATLPLGIDWDALTAQLESGAAPVVVESCVQHGDGRIVWLQASPALAPREGAPPHVEWTVVDATDRYMRWRQLRQAQRLDAVRDLTISAGQDVIERLAAAMRAEPLAADRELGRSLARAREVAEQLVAFAQRQARLPHLLDLNDTLRQLTVTLRRLAGSDVLVNTDLTGGPVMVSVDPSETEQWVTSLVVAARDALPAGGTLTLRTRLVDLTALGDAGQRRIIPAVRVSLVASGFGARPVQVPTTLADVVVQRGGTLRASHAPESSSARFDLHLPVVHAVRTADGPFPLAPTEAERVRSE